MYMLLDPPPGTIHLLVLGSLGIEYKGRFKQTFLMWHLPDSVLCYYILILDTVQIIYVYIYIHVPGTFGPSFAPLLQPYTHMYICTCIYIYKYIHTHIRRIFCLKTLLNNFLRCESPSPPKTLRSPHPMLVSITCHHSGWGAKWGSLNMAWKWWDSSWTSN